MWNSIIGKMLQNSFSLPKRKYQVWAGQRPPATYMGCQQTGSQPKSKVSPRAAWAQKSRFSLTLKHPKMASTATFIIAASQP
jgi:hypothetical protein